MQLERIWRAAGLAVALAVPLACAGGTLASNLELPGLGHDLPQRNILADQLTTGLHRPERGARLGGSRTSRPCGQVARRTLLPGQPFRDAVREPYLSIRQGSLVVFQNGGLTLTTQPSHPERGRGDVITAQSGQRRHYSRTVEQTDNRMGLNDSGGPSFSWPCVPAPFRRARRSHQGHCRHSGVRPNQLSATALSSPQRHGRQPAQRTLHGTVAASMLDRMGINVRSARARRATLLAVMYS